MAGITISDKYWWATREKLDKTMDKIADEPLVGALGATAINSEQLQKAREDCAANKPTVESVRTNEIYYCPYCGVKMRIAKAPIGNWCRFVCGCGVSGPNADSPEAAKEAMEQFIAKTISRSLEIAEEKVQGEIIYLQEKLKQAENDRDFALDALADIAKGMKLCTPYPAATKRIVLQEFERLKRLTQIPCGTGEAHND